MKAILFLMPLWLILSYSLLDTYATSFDSGSVSDDEFPSRQGYICATNGETSAAIKLLNRAVAKNPSDAVAFYNLGSAYVQCGNFNEAIFNLSQALALDSRMEMAFNNRGIAHCMKGELTSGIDDFSAAVRINTSNGFSFYNRGCAYTNLKELEKAIADFDRSIKLNFNVSLSYSHRGNLFYLKHDWEKAISDFSDALAGASTNIEALNGLAWIYSTCPNSNLRNSSRAIVLAETACKITEWSQWFYIGTLAAAYAAHGDFDKAVAMQQKALEVKGCSKMELLGQQQRLKLYEQRKPFVDRTDQ